MPTKNAPDRVRRYDRASSSATSARRLPNGWLRTDGIVARTGIQSYTRPDGTVLRELRLPEEVFRAETLDALAMAPVTDEHPPAMLDATNTTAFQRGTLGEQIEVLDDRLVKAPLLITDEQLIQKVLSGEQTELSVGYLCDLEHTPGVWRGQKYDAIQRNIMPNHVAITHRARGGPELRVRLDACDAVSHRDDVEDEVPLPGSGPKPTSTDRLRALEELWRTPTAGMTSSGPLAPPVPPPPSGATSREKMLHDLENAWRRPFRVGATRGE